MSRTPLVSVCVPTYNGSEFVGACLDGLLGQELRDLEVLVGDDQSTDDTLEVVRRRADPRLRILPFRTRAGMAANWNRCLAEARGEYVALVAQDDLVAPAWGARLVHLLESHREAGLAFGHRKFAIADETSRAAVGEFFESTYPAMLARFHARIGTVVPPEVMVDAAMEHRFEVNLVGEPSFTMVRRDLPETRAGYHTEMKQLLDWEFATRFFVDRPILHCAEDLGTYRIHASGSTVGNAPIVQQYREYRLLYGCVMDRFRDRLSPDQARELREYRVLREDLMLAYARALESERDQLKAHAATLETERGHLLGHARVLESERDQLKAHAATLETERGHLLGHVQNLEQALTWIRGDRAYRALCKLRARFKRRPSP